MTGPELERVPRPGERTVPPVAGVPAETLTDRASVFGRPELLQALAAAQPHGADRDVVALPRGPVPAGLTEARFTTRELLELEQDLIEYATRPKCGNRAQVSISAVQAACAGRGLSEEQAAVVTDLCWRGGHVSVIRAAAGTGKTFVLDAAREAWQSREVEVLGCALSARAALELSDQAVIPSVTIAQLTGRLDDGAQLPWQGVLVVDEAGMVGTRDLARLAEAAERSCVKHCARR